MARNCSRGYANSVKWGLHNCESFAAFACPLALPVAAIVMLKALSTSLFRMLAEFDRIWKGGGLIEGLSIPISTSFFFKIGFDVAENDSLKVCQEDPKGS